MNLVKMAATEYLGDYDYYVEKKLEQEELKALEETNKQTVAPGKTGKKQLPTG